MNKINPEMVTLAREYRGKTQSQLAKEMNITQGYLSKVEKSLLPGNEDFLNSISQVLDLQPEFFTRKGNTFLPNLYYRKLVRTSAHTLTKADAEMNIHRLNIQALLTSIDIGTKPVPTMDIDEVGDAKIIAKKVRQLWGIPSGPIVNLFDTIERNGVIIVPCDFDSTELVGRSMYTDDKQPLIFVNKNVSFDRQRFTVCHELGHLIMHMAFSVEGENRDEEKEANIFASEFLIPEADLKKQIMSKYLTLPQLADFKRYWKVSMQAIAYKANECCLINNYTALMKTMSALGMRKREPVELDPPMEKSVLLNALIETHLNALDYTLMDVAKMFGFSLQETRRLYLQEEGQAKMRAIFR